MGLSAEHSAELALQTLSGTARLLETGTTPEQLRIMVTSPGGTTAAGLNIFEEKGLKNIVVDALQAALRRAEELGGK
jgi:pyrroline-5-carboxylate reductase